MPTHNPSRASWDFTPAALIAALLCGQPTSAPRAEISLYADEKLSLGLAFDAAIAHYKTWNTNFGAGLAKPNGGVFNDAQYSEGYALPVLNAVYRSENAGAPYGGLGWVFTKTWGDGDPGGISFDQPGSVGLERAYMGWRSGNLFPSLGEDVFDVSYGRQEFQIGNGFLIADGNFDRLDKGNVLLGPRTAFKRAGIVQVNTKPVRFDLFYLSSDNDSDNPHLFGGNVEYINETYGTLGFYGFTIFDADEGTTRDGLTTWSVRGEVNPLAYFGVNDSHFAFEYADQHNNRDGRKLDAEGWYASAGYRFSALPWAPDLTYRYSHFSGDNPDTATSEAFDPLFVGAPTFGTWFQGEITGEYLITNSNIDVHMVSLTATPPVDGLTLGVLFFDNTLDNPVSAGAVSSDFNREINVYADFQMTDWFAITPLFALAIPGDGAKEIYGQDENYTLFEVFSTFSF